MDPFSIAALVAMFVGAGVQYDATRQANKAVERETLASLEKQKQLREKAEQRAMEAAKQFDPKSRQSDQARIEAQMTSDMVAPVNESQMVRAAQQTTQGNVSKDYTTAKAASDAATLKSAHELARLLGKVESAGRLRMNEGLALSEAGNGIDMLANFSQRQAAADDIAIRAAAQPNAEKVLLGTLLQGAGTAGLMYGGGAGAGGAEKYALGDAGKAANPWGVTATPAAGNSLQLYGSTPSFGIKPTARSMQALFGA